ncbi:hypothetical protein RFI_17479 [Reticulomyxa filosa]|uniref:EF-hand domain-containing protein n=1 Tax=Reticulomyxa filosa TaxID=46433 RepID=X6N0Z8_RETFI|nr:hypothetical protein RFI_17479 [Reticulomyxa filosa]|eukprot:ETO19751.1 hypothetical protein RFI_17479 [Reticulomyxa filosa]
MGCLHSSPKPSQESGREALCKFLENEEQLTTIWNQFNGDDDDVLDKDEFDQLLFTALQIFCQNTNRKTSLQSDYVFESKKKQMEIQIFKNDNNNNDKKKAKDPQVKPPSRDSMEPFIEKLRSELVPRIGVNGTGAISYEEFKLFGTYLKQEYAKIEKFSYYN